MKLPQELFKAGGEGLNQIFGSLAQIKSISDKNKILVCYIENNYLVDYYQGIINDERTLLIVPGIHRLFIIESLYMIKKYNTIIAYVTESDHRTKTMNNIPKAVEINPLSEPIKTILNKFTDDKTLEEATNIFKNIKTEDFGFTISPLNEKTIKNKDFDFSADSFMVASKQWFVIGKKPTPIVLLAVIIIGFFGGIIFGVFGLTIIQLLAKVITIVIH